MHNGMYDVLNVLCTHIFDMYQVQLNFVVLLVLLTSVQGGPNLPIYAVMYL